MAPPIPQYVFKRTKTFRRNFDGLPPAQKEAARECFALFKWNPFDPRLRPHIITKLTAKRKMHIWSVTVESDLRVVFSMHGNVILSEDIGKHSIYQ